MDTNVNGIAIIGMSGRFPGARNVEEFWQNLLAGVESISFFSDEELAASGVDAAAVRSDPRYVAGRGIVKDPEWFDAGFFQISDREAEIIDPQQRLFLEASWEALEHAGYDPATVKGYVGVYAGKSGSSYYLTNVFSRPELLGMFSNLGFATGDKDYLATRVAYKLNLKGPAMSVATACSTSLVAVCQACQALLCYQCDLALAGGVSVTFPQIRAYLPDGGMLSSDGHCRPFDSQATGTNFSDGLGIVVLKRLAEALQDGDRIYAVIKGFALNNDGSAKVGFAAPSVDGQAEVIALALAQAGIEPGTISYVETHGTATPLGDPIEIAGLAKAFGAGKSQPGSCAIGSVKGNLGHLDAAAGVTSLIKTALALKHKVLPPSINFVAPNPKIDFANSPFAVNARLTEWKASSTPRRAGVSNFGVGGTNAHVVLEEAPLAPSSNPARDWQLLLLSARTPSALDTATANLREHLKQNPELNLADVAWTLQTRRHAFDHRRMLVCRNLADAVEALEERTHKRVMTEEAKVRNRSIVFMFPGQGSQYVNMGADLYRSERLFRETIDKCSEILAPQLGIDLRAVLFPAAGGEKAAEELLIQTRITQPALFVIEYALATLWTSWGIKPRAMIGHSVGEYVAACLAGVFTLEDALGIVAGRAKLVQAQPGGAMLAVRLPEKELIPLLNGSLSIAAINSPKLSVASGPFEAVAELEAQLKSQGVASRRLQTSHAFHSAMMDPVLEPLIALLKKVQFRKPSIPYLSNVSGTWITDREATDPGYWAHHVREAVRFADGAGELLKEPETILLEVGSGQTLCSLVNQHSAKTATHLVVPSLSSPGEEMPSLLAALGKLWLAGTQVDWAGVYGHQKRSHIVLPTYPFERKRYWIEPAHRQIASVSAPATEPVAGATSVSALPATMDSAPNDAPSTAAESRRARILATLTAEFQALSSANLSEVGPSATFIEMGLDSLFLMQAAQMIERQFGVRIAFRHLLQELNTLNELTDHLDRSMPPEGAPAAVPAPVTQPASAAAPAPPPQPAPVPQPVAAASALEAIQAQLQALSRQIELLRQASMGSAANAPSRSNESAAVKAEVPQASAAHQEIAAPEQRAESDIARTEIITLPMSEAQLELWLAASSGPEASCAFNQTRLIHLRDSISYDALRDALRALVNRHDALRTTYLPDGSGQQIHPKIILEVPLHDLSALSAADAERKLEEFVELEDRTPFDLAKGPVVRAQILKLSELHHVLILGAHHLALDGWSGSVVLHDLGRLYSAKLQGSPDGLGPAMQYRDYLEWQELAENRKRREESEAFWVDAFAHPPVAAELPADRPRPPLKSYQADTRNVVLNAGLYGSLRKAAAEQGCTLFTYLVASLNVWLHRHSGQEDLVLGIHAAGQSAVNDPKYQGSRSLVGHCVNLLPLRSQCNGRSPLRDYLKNLSRSVIDAYEHQDFTYGSLVKRLNLPREGGRTPLIALTFNLTPEARTRLLPGWKVIISRKDFIFFDLMFEMHAAEGELHVDCRFNRDLYDADTIARWLQHWKVLLEGMLRNPEQPISMLPMLTQGESRRLLHDWNATTAEYPKETSLAQLVEAQVERTPDAIAVADERRRLSFRELNARANQLAHELIGHGAGPERVVGLCVERSADLMVALLAIVKTGGAYLPLDPIFPPERLSYMLEDSGAPLLVTEKSLVATLPGFGGKTVLLEDEGWRRNPSSNPDIAVDPENLAYLIYTSGSTGKPKGVEVPRRALTNFLWSMREWLGLNERDRVLTVTTISFDIAGLEIWLPLIVGAQTVVASRAAVADGQALRNLLDRHDITFMQATPVTWRLLFEAGWEGKANLQVACGGEAMPPEVAGRLAPAVKHLWNLYGPTETTIWSTGCRIANGKLPISIGRPLANTTIYILDGHGQPAPVGISGELCIGGDGLARGYHNQPELTAEKFVADPFQGKGAKMYRTGDLARYHADGNIECLGRIDHQVKVRGFRIELGEIEARLAEHPAVREAVVVAREDSRGDKRLIAYYTSCSDKDGTGAAEFRSHLSVSLPEYMVPATYVRLQALPLTPNGKVDRKALPAPDADPYSARSFEPPQGAIEEKLAKIFAEALNTDKVSRNDNFFDLGAHSLTAVRVISAINRVLNIELPLRILFQAQSVAQVAALIREKYSLDDQQPADEWPICVPIQPAGSRLPLFCVARPNVNALGYLALSRRLGANQPVYVLQRQLVEDPVLNFTPEQIAATARDYIAAMRAVQPQGPYHLMGQCQGGYIAFEMTRLLERQGERVAVLGMLDVWPEENTRYKPLFFAQLYTKELLALFRGGAKKGTNSKLPGDVNHGNNGNGKAAEPVKGNDSGHPLWKTYWPGPDYKPMTVSARIVVFRVPDQPFYRIRDKAMGWGKRTTGPVEVVEMGGDHFLILREPHVGVLADALAVRVEQTISEVDS